MPTSLFLAWRRCGARILLPVILLTPQAAGEDAKAASNAHVTLKSGKVLAGRVVGSEKAEAGSLLVVETEAGEIRVPKPQVATVQAEAPPAPGASFDVREIHVTRIVGRVEARASDADAWRTVAWTDEYGKPVKNEPNALVRPGDRVRTGKDGLFEVMLHSKVWLRLFAETEAVFPLATPPSEASMKVGAGRAQLEVQGLPRGRTFRLGTPSAILGVRGTRLAVEASAAGERLLVFAGTVERDATAVSAGQMLDVADPATRPTAIPSGAATRYEAPPVRMTRQDAVLVPGGTYRLKGRPPPPGVMIAVHPDDWTRGTDVEVRTVDVLFDRRPASNVDLGAYERSQVADRGTVAPAATATVTMDWAQAEGLVRWQGRDVPTEAQFEVAVRGPAGKWPPPRTDVEYSWQGDLRYQDPLYAHPSDVSPWGVPGLLKHERLWMRDFYTQSPFFHPGASEKAAFEEWTRANASLRVERGIFPGIYPGVYPGTARSPKHADPLLRAPADAAGIGFVRGVVELEAR